MIVFPSLADLLETDLTKTSREALSGHREAVGHSAVADDGHDGQGDESQRPFGAQVTNLGDGEGKHGCVLVLPY